MGILSLFVTNYFRDDLGPPFTLLVAEEPLNNYYRVPSHGWLGMIFFKTGHCLNMVLPTLGPRSLSPSFPGRP